MWTLLGWILFCSLTGPLQGVVQESSPGIIAVISKAAAHRYVTTAFLQNSLIQSHLLLIQFPDAPHKGHLEHWIKGLHVVRVFVPHIQIELRDEVSTIIVRTRLHLSTKFFFGKHFEQIDIIIDVNFKTDGSFFNFDLGNVDISFGTCRSDFKIVRIIASSRLQVAKVQPIVKTVLAASLPRLLCETLHRLLQIIRFDFLYTANVFLHMGTTASIQYQLASKPLSTSAYYVVELHMIIRIKHQFLIVPFSQAPLPLPSLRDNAISLGLTQDSLNVIMGALLQIQKQELIFTKELFPGAAELISVITDLFSHRKCPKCPVRSPLKMVITLVGTKKITLQPDLITLHLSVQISILAMSSSGAPYGLFVLKANLSLGVHATVHDNKLIFFSTMTSVDLLLVSSELGPIEVSSLQKWIKLLLNERYLPQINDCLNVGIPLPSLLHVGVIYPVIEVIQGMLLLCV